MFAGKEEVFETFAKSSNGCSLVNINARDGTLPLWNRSSSHDLGVKSIKILNKIRINIFSMPYPLCKDTTHIKKMRVFNLNLTFQTNTSPASRGYAVRVRVANNRLVNTINIANMVFYRYILSSVISFW